ncbi:hypothetical protein AB0O28_39395 [Microbispora sp. NPDC088329]|uniref:hypothetical protein n=1 Tax=Microbispora sp. NPDC088329 TaxID=3154869 RepID=UPI00342050C0
MTAAPVLPFRHPRGLTPVPGSPGWSYQLDPGRIVKGSGDEERVTTVLDWCPVVTERLVTLREDGTAGETYYRLTVGEDTATVSHEDVATHKVWHRIATPGTGTRNIRDVLTNVITSQGAQLPRVLAVTRTGWHGTPEGDRIYVYADGRTWPENGRAHLIGMPERLASAARPVEPVEPDGVRAALVELVESGGWAPLFGLAAGARSLGQSIRPVSAALVIWGDPNAGKTCTATAGRMLMLSGDWPPVVTARFNDTVTDLEMSVDAEADMPTLLDDLALTADASQVEQRAARDMLERIIRPVGNQEAIRGRRRRDLTAMDRRYVRSIPVITAQQLPRGMQASLYRRAVVLHLAAGSANVRWWAPVAKGGQGGAERVGAALRTIGDRIIARLGTADDPGALLADAERAALAVLGPAVDRAAPGWADSADGMAGVIHAAAGMMAGLVLIADAAGVEPGPLLAAVVEPVARTLAEQADTMADRRVATDDLAAAVGDIIRRALMERRAHIADAAGDVGPGLGPEGLTATEMGLRQAGRDDFGRTAWEGGGPPLYWLPDRGGIGVRSTALHDLVRANGDPRAAGYTSESLARALHRGKALIPSRERGRETSHQVRLKGHDKTTRLVILRPDVVWPDQAEDGGAPAAPLAPRPAAGPDTTPGPVEPGHVGQEQAAVSVSPAQPVIEAAKSDPPAQVPARVETAPAGPVLAIGADTYGLVLGDGRTEDPGDAYASMPAFLARLVELMPEGGTVALAAAVAAGLGYPARPDNARPGRKGPAKKHQDCRAVEAARADGWECSAAGVGAWTIWHGAGRPSLAVVVLDWLDPRKMGVSGAPYLRADHDPATAAYLLQAYRERTGVPYVMTAGTSGVNMIRHEYSGARRGRRRPPLMKWDGTGSPAAEVQENAAVWSRPATDEERSAGWVIGYDARMAYLAAAGVADLAVDRLEHTGTPGGFDPSRAGYWLVSGQWQPYPMLPPLTGRAGDGTAWLTTPTVRLLIDHGMPEDAITDAWLSAGRQGHTARLLRGPVERIRDGIAGIPADVENEDAAVRDALKATYREMVGMLRRGTAYIVRPDWSDTIIAQSRANLLRKAIKIGRETGRWPLRVDTDALWYAAAGPDPATACPAGLPLYDPAMGAGLGTFTPKHVMTMTDYLGKEG